MFVKSKQHAISATSFQSAIWKPLTLVAGLFLLSACGSSDKFPGSSNNQEPDPLVVDSPLFYIERPLRSGQNGGIAPDDLKDPLTFHGNAKLIMKVRADQSATTVDISAQAMSGNVDVRDLDVSADGMFVLFSLRAPQRENVDEEEQPTWNIWEYDIVNSQVRRLISSNIQAEIGHDITPRYLPNGNIIFASTRQTKSRTILSVDGKEQFSHIVERNSQLPALNLHVLNPRTQEIEQVTFNQSHDFYPTVMNNGKVVFTRWENFGSDALSLYEMNPDGTELQLLYGHHSQGTGDDNTRTRFVRSSVMPDGDLFALVRPDETTFYGGNFVRIDTESYIDNTRSTATSSGSGPAQTPVTDRIIITDGTLSLGGYYSAFFPLWDGSDRAIVSWSRCRITLDGTTLPCNDSNISAPGAVTAPPAYGIWTYDYTNDTQIPIITAREGVVYTDVVLAAERPLPSIRRNGDSLNGVIEGKVSANTFSFMMEAENEEAIIHIRNVYDFDGTYDDLGSGLSYDVVSDPSDPAAAQRPARFLRVIKAVSEPSRELRQLANGSFGVAGAQRMKEILGYAPIEPDGSVKVRVPANVALMISMVDANGKMLRSNGSSGALLRHQNWITLRPGEVMECKGCHTATSTAPHGRYDAQADSINLGQPDGSTYPGADTAITSPFANATMAEALVAHANADNDYPPCDSENLPPFCKDDIGDDDIMELSTDLLFSDVWSPTPGTDPDIRIHYASLPGGLTSPANGNCDQFENQDEYNVPPPVPVRAQGWNSGCRIVINYEDHIQPIWELDRGALTTPIRDRDGQVILDTTVTPSVPMTQILANDGQPATCIRCHSRVDAANMPQVPAGQLELTNQVDGTNGIQNRSYVDLFNRDVELVLEGGAIVDCTQQVPRLDEFGVQLEDEFGNLLFDIVTCPADVPAAMSGQGAFSSNRFFSPFEGAGTHVGYLTPAELKLIAEWLDIGAQYYNNHFDAPEN